MIANPKPVIGLDVLRLIAAFMVVSYHLGFRTYSDDGYLLNDLIGGDVELESWSPLTWFGWVGVQVFFVISGFVIAFSSEGATPSKFIRSRVLRLVPGMWVCVLICGGLALAWGIPAAKVLYLSAKTAAFVPFGPWIAGQVWTIGIELAFYALILGLLWRGAFGRVEVLAYALAAASAAYWIAIEAGLAVDTAGRITQLLLLQHGCYFAIGLFFWVASRRGNTVARSIAVLVCIATAWFQIQATLVAEHPDYGYLQHSITPFAAWLGLIVLMAASIAYNEQFLSALPAWVPSMTRTAGVMTYSLYLLHYHVGGTSALLAHKAGASDMAAFALAIVASLVAAYGSAKVFEPAIYGWLRQIIDRRERARPIAKIA